MASFINLNPLKFRSYLLSMVYDLTNSIFDPTPHHCCSLVKRQHHKGGIRTDCYNPTARRASVNKGSWMLKT